MTTAEDEEWRPIADFDGYEVSNRGRLRSWKSGRVRILSPALDRGGYRTAAIRRRGKTAGIKIHREVLKAFVGPPPPGKPTCCHNDGNRTNNRVENLRWDSPKGNSGDRAAHGTLIRGEELVTSKMTERQVLAIDAELRTGRMSAASIARFFDVPQSRVSQIARGKSWAWLTGRPPYVPMALRAAC